MMTLGVGKEVEKGKKSDEGKLPMDIILEQFPRALEGVASCSKYGNDKYKLQDLDWNNWSRVDNAEFRYSQALMRHRISRAKGNNYDDESKLPHLFHQAWNTLALLELKLRNGEYKI